MPEAGFQMSKRSAVRRSPASERMPDISWRPGLLHRFGRTSASGIVKPPENETGSDSSRPRACR